MSTPNNQKSNDSEEFARPGISSNRGYRHTLLILLILFVCTVVVLIINAWSDHLEHRASQQQMVENTARGVIAQIEQEIENLRRNIRHLTKSILHDDSQQSQQQGLIEGLLPSLNDLLPHAKAIVISDAHGKPLSYSHYWDSHKQDIQYYIENKRLPNIVMHHQDDEFYFNIMVPHTSQIGKKYLVIVSFTPEQISKILRNHQLYGHRLVIVNNRQNDMIEITGAGSRKGMKKSQYFLSKIDLKNIQHKHFVKGTQWDLLDIEVGGKLVKQLQREIYKTSLQMLILLILSFFIYRQIRSSISDIQIKNAELDQQNRLTQQQNVRLERAQSIAKLDYWNYQLAGGELVLSDNGRRLLNLDETDSISGKDFIQRVDPRDRNKLRYCIASAMVRKKSIHIEFRFNITKDFQRNMFTSAEPCFDANGKLVSLFGVVQDVTDKRKAERKSRDATIARLRAEESNKAKSAFIANMSHEIRTPMNAILGFAESLLDTSLSGDEKSDATHTIIRNGHHLLKLINDILDLSKVEANKLELEHLDTDIFPLLTDVESLIKPQAIAKGLNFHLAYEFPVPVRIISDPLRLKQVLINLCGNALKFTEEGYIKLSVRFDAEQQLLTFAIEDTGVGMTEEQAAKVFSAFEQADASTTRKYGGTGLGLSLSKEFAEKLGGSLSVSSEPNIGSTFTFSIYIGEVQNDSLVMNPEMIPKPPPLQINIEPDRKVQGHVLLAEDTIDSQKLISMLINKTGAKVTSVENGKQAIIAAQTTDFDLVFMDMQMPVMDGMSAVRHLRKKGYKVPIVALTANAMAEDRRLCIDAGCDGFLTKPIDRAELYSTVHQYLDVVDSPGHDEQPIVSLILEEEPEYTDLVERYAEDLFRRHEKLQNLLNQHDWENLRSELHQLKGSGGHFGYPMITELAAEMESLAKDKNQANLLRLLNSLETLTKRINLGLPDTRKAG